MFVINRFTFQVILTEDLFGEIESDALSFAV
jgi:isocitrate/isopropylmalate dehydrogenase